jgi:hypothetical protein
VFVAHRDWDEAGILAVLIIIWAIGAYGAVEWYRGNLWWTSMYAADVNRDRLAEYEKKLAEWKLKSEPPVEIEHHVNGYTYTLVPNRTYRKPGPEPAPPEIFIMETTWGPLTAIARLLVLVWVFWNLQMLIYFVPWEVRRFGQWLARRIFPPPPPDVLNDREQERRRHAT